MINLALRSEFSFRQTYGKVKDLCAAYGNAGALGFADINNTFAHTYLQKEADKNGFKPIFGVRLEVLEKLGKVRGECGPFYIFIARNTDGLHEINKLVKTSHDNFYFKPRLSLDNVRALSENVIVIAENMQSTDRVDYIALTPSTSKLIFALDIPKVYINNNFFSSPEDRAVYQILAGSQKRGDEYFYKFDNKRAFQHILNEAEFNRIWNCPEAAANTRKIAGECEARIPKAKMVAYTGSRTLEAWCLAGAKARGIDLQRGEYADRYSRELQIIEEKKYKDYFMIVAEMVEKAKRKMFVGPGRGCFLPGQKVYMANNTEENIENIKIGNHVLDAYGVRRRVNGAMQYMVNETVVEFETEDGRTVKCTEDHKILTNRGWVAAGDLTCDDSVYKVEKSGNLYPMWLAKMVSHGWPYDLAVKWKENGFIEFAEIGRIPLDYSKKMVRMDCRVCEKSKFVQLRKLSNRVYLKNQNVCTDCILKETLNLPEARIANSNAQKIAQNIPSQRAANSASVRMSKRGNCNHYDEYYVTRAYRKLFHQLYNNKCQLCNKESELIHHIIPGGPSNPENMIPLCHSCHTGIHNFQHIEEKFNEVQDELFSITGEAIDNAKENESEIYKTIQLFWESV